MARPVKGNAYCEICGCKLIRKNEIDSLTCDQCYGKGKQAWTGFDFRAPTQYGDRLEQGFALLHQYED